VLGVFTAPGFDSSKFMLAHNLAAPGDVIVITQGGLEVMRGVCGDLALYARLGQQNPPPKRGQLTGSTHMVFSLLGMAARLGQAIVDVKVAEGIALEEASQLVEETAKEAIGSYKWGWPSLKAETIARKATGDSPLLETGELRASIEHQVAGRSRHVGTNAFQAEWMEFGNTRGSPPRPFILPAAMASEDAIHKIVGETVFSALAGHDVGGLAEEILHKSVESLKESDEYFHDKAEGEDQ
jgi:hypothetical protein